MRQSTSSTNEAELSTSNENSDRPLLGTRETPAGDADEQTDSPDSIRSCRDCSQSKPILNEEGVSNFSPLPWGGYSSVCTACTNAKRLETIRNKEVTNRDWILKELRKNYHELKRGSEKTRCLEVMAKLLTKDENTPIDDAAVIKSLVESMRETQNEARREKAAEKRNAT